MASVMWAFQVRSLEIVRPKSFALSTVLMSSSPMTIGGNVLITSANEIRRSLHFSLFSWSLFLLDQSTTS